jgi:hypothetical protein
MYKHGLARIHASALLINSLFSGCDKREGELPVGFVNRLKAAISVTKILEFAFL